jgi:DNA-binding response OmpR family regulator
LVVDDNVDSAEKLAMILVLKAVADGGADVVLLDLGLPTLSGFESLAKSA